MHEWIGLFSRLAVNLKRPKLDIHRRAVPGRYGHGVYERDSRDRAVSGGRFMLRARGRSHSGRTATRPGSGQFQIKGRCLRELDLATVAEIR